MIIFRSARVHLILKIEVIDRFHILYPIETEMLDFVELNIDISATHFFRKKTHMWSSATAAQQSAAVVPDRTRCDKNMVPSAFMVYHEYILFTACDFYRIVFYSSDNIVGILYLQYCQNE